MGKTLLRYFITKYGWNPPTKRIPAFFMEKIFFCMQQKSLFSRTPFVFLALLITFVYNERKGRDRNMHFTKGGNL